MNKFEKYYIYKHTQRMTAKKNANRQACRVQKHSRVYSLSSFNNFFKLNPFSKNTCSNWRSRV